MDDRSSNDLNASATAAAPPAHASAVHSSAALNAAADSGPFTHTAAATTAAEEQSSPRVPLELTDSAGSVASAPASAASSVSGRKRAASAAPDAGSSSAATDESEAAGPSASSAAALFSSSDGLSQCQPQSKKHRGGSAQAGRSQAPAAASAGVDPQRAAPSNAAVSSASSGDGHGSPAARMTDATSSGALTDERKEASDVVGSAAASGLAAATADSAGSSASVTRPCPFDAGAILQLVVDGVALAEYDLQRWKEQQAPIIADMMQMRADSEAQLRALLARPVAHQAARQQDRLWWQEQVASCTGVLGDFARHSSAVREDIDSARAAITQPDLPLLAIRRLCTTVRSLLVRALLSHDPHGVRAWMQRLDLLFTQIADRLPRLALTTDECDELLFAALNAGALQLVPALMQQGNMRAGCGAFDLVSLCLDPTRHFVSHQPYLRLFRYGLDPTHIFPKQSPLSALQMASDLIRDPALAIEAAAEPAVMAPATAASSSSAPATHEPIPSVLAAWAAQQQETAWQAEGHRRATLHAQFMHAVLPAWLAHSNAVLALLSAPSVLIPDLAVIVGHYLDLEGLPAEPAEAVDEDDAQTDAEQ